MLAGAIRLLVLAVFALHLGDDLFRHRPWRFFVLLELHRVIRATLSCSAHVSGITKHGRQWHGGADGLGIADHFHALDPSATRVQIADDGAHVILGNDDFDRHHPVSYTHL